MPGKITQSASWSGITDLADLPPYAPDDEVRTFTPMRTVPVVHLVDGEDRVVTPMVWGFTDRRATGRRIPKFMHARGETVHQLRTFADAFRLRRGITFARTFNDGREVEVLYDDGSPAGKTWTQQLVIGPADGRPIIIAVVYDIFDVGNGREYEFSQLTVPANAQLAAITDRMPLILSADDLDVWLGEQRAPLEDVIDLIRTFEFVPEWLMQPEDPDKQPPRPRKPNKPPPQDSFL